MNDNCAQESCDWVEAVRANALGIRMRVLDHCIRNNGGYLSQACSSAEILSTLYMKSMKLGPSIGEPLPSAFKGTPGTPGVQYTNGAGYNGALGPDLDRFFISPAHYALAVYAALIQTGRMSMQALDQFNKDGSVVEMIGAEHSPGFEAMGGALAQTLSQAAGLAWARMKSKDSGKVFVFLSDGEFQEGQTWETIQTLCFFGITNLIAFVDVNGHQCDGAMKEVMDIGSLEDKIRVFGADALTVDGHDPFAIDAAAQSLGARSRFVLCQTDPARGIGILEKRYPKLHYLRFSSAEEKRKYERFFEDQSWR